MDLFLGDIISEDEKSTLPVWDFPVNDKYTKLWKKMKEFQIPQSFDEALERVRSSPSQSEGFALLGDNANDDNDSDNDDDCRGRLGYQIPGADLLRPPNGWRRD